MLYLDSFTLPGASDEESFILSYPKQFEMQCYDNNNAYPFKIFPGKGLRSLNFEPITLIHGSNGSGKSTILNLIAEKLDIERSAPFNYAPCMPDYLEMCEYELYRGAERIPRASRIITSDDVFDFLLDIRAVNRGIDMRREELFAEYDRERDTDMRPLASLDEFDDFKRRLDVRRQTKSSFTGRRLPKELRGRSNGESAFLYFTEKIREGALYLLDEPENSLSASLQTELARFIEESARFYKCQFIISTHSPFILSMKGAKIYDLDSTPVCEARWSDLRCVREYYDLFVKNKSLFEKEGEG